MPSGLPTSNIPKNPTIVRFDHFEADLRAGELRRNGIKVRIQERPFQLLAVLLQHAGQVVTRDELRRELLPPNTFVDFDASLATSVRKLRDALVDSAENPKYVETVGRRGYRFLMPVSLPPTAGGEPDLTPHLVPSVKPEQEGLVSVGQVFPSAYAWPRRILLIASLPILLLLIYYIFGVRRVQGGPNSIPRRKAVAVLGFKNLTGQQESQWLSTGLSEMISTELAAGGRLHLIPAEDVARVKNDLHLPEGETLSADSLGLLRKNLGADLVVLGTYTVIGTGNDPTIRCDLRLQDTVGGETIATLAETGHVSNLFNLVAATGSELRRKAGITQILATESASALNALPSNSEAERLYAEARQKLRVFDTPAARDLLLQAIAADPKHAAAHLTLARVWDDLGYETKAAEEAKIAVSLSANLPREQQLSIAARSDETTHQWEKAVSTYRTLFDFFPDNLNYGIALASAQMKASRPNDALATTAKLRTMPMSSLDDAQLDHIASEAYGFAGDHIKAEHFAATASTKAANLGARLLEARALARDAWEWERMGNPDKSQEKSLEAEQIYSAAGDRVSVGYIRLLQSDVLYDKADYDGARRLVISTVPIFQELGAQKYLRAAYERIGNAYYEQGRLAEARDQYQHALNIDLDRQNTGNLASDYGNLANVLDGLGDLSGALKMNQESLDRFNEAGDKRGASATLDNLGTVMIEMGDLDNAQKNYEQSLAMARQDGFRRGEFYPLSGLADVQAARGDLEGARAKYEQVVSLCEQMEQKNFAAQARVSLAFVALEQKRFSDGEALARLAVSEFDEERANQEDAWAHAVLARNLLAENKIDEARVAALKAVAVSEQTPSHNGRFEAILASARTQASSGNASSGTEQLRRMLNTARQFHYRLYEYEARLALCEIEAKTKPGATARSSASLLEKEARQQGFLLLATDAHSLAQAK